MLEEEVGGGAELKPGCRSWSKGFTRDWIDFRNATEDHI
jgi:hypothetical protein